MFHGWLTEKEITPAPGGGLHKAVTTALNGLEMWSWLCAVPEKLPPWPASRLDEMQAQAEQPQN